MLIPWAYFQSRGNIRPTPSKISVGLIIGVDQVLGETRYLKQNFLELLEHPTWPKLLENTVLVFFKIYVVPFTLPSHRQT